MSKLKRQLSVVCSLLLAVLMVMSPLSGCSNKKGPTGPEAQCTVTFDKNTSHTTNTIQPQTVDNGKTVKQPQVFVTDVDETSRFSVTGWYTSKDCKEDEKWNFANPVTKSMTLYAAWQEKVKVELYLGATATTPASTQWVVKGGKAEREDGLVGNYKLDGYYTDKDFTGEFDFDTALNADQKLYLKYDATKAYLFANHLASMTYGYGVHYVYVSKYCPEHRIEVTGSKCTTEGCTAELVDPSTVTTKYCPDCKQDIEASAVAEDDTHTGCTAEVETHSKVTDPAGEVAAKQRPEGFYPSSVKKETQEAEGDNEAFDYARFDFGNLQQPYLWYNPLNIDIKGMNELTITYRNMGKGRAIRFYYVVGYLREDGQYNYSGNGMFAKYVDINIGEADKQWHTVTIDMGAKTISDIDGISEWGTADLLSIFRIDYPYKSYDADEYKQELVKPGDSILDVAEVVFSANGKDYSAADSLDFGSDSGYGEGAPENDDWTWSVDTQGGAQLYNQGGTPTAFFPYETTGNTLTATATQSNEIDCDAETNKALTVIYNNLGYGTSATLTWKTSNGEGSKNVSLESRANGKTIYIDMINESTWTGKLESLTLTYVKKGVNNAITINSVKIDSPKPENVPGVSFKNGKAGFTGTWKDKSMVVDTTGIVKTAAEGETVLDIDSAIVYKGFTVWYKQGATAATKLTLTYTDDKDTQHSAEATLTSGEGEKQASFTFVDAASGRSAMSGKIKDIKLAADAGSVLVTYIYFDFDVHDAYFDMTEVGTTNIPGIGVSGDNAILNAEWSSNLGLGMTYEVTNSNNGTAFSFSEEKNAYQISFTQGASFNVQLTAISADVPGIGKAERQIPVSDIKEGKLYLIWHNEVANRKFHTYIFVDGTPKLHSIDMPVNDEYEWSVIEIDISEDIKGGTYITNFMIQTTAAGNAYLRAMIFR